MAKYATVIPCSEGYRPGLNAILNGLDLYENNIDVFVLDWGDLNKEWVEKARKTDWNFKLEILDIKPYTSAGRSAHYNLVFAPYKVFIEKMGQYTAMSWLGSDMAIVDNIMDWFDVAEKTGKFVTADNSYNFKSVEDLEIGENGLTSGDAVGDMPGIFSTQHHRVLIEKIIELGEKTDSNMRALNTALHLLKIKPLRLTDFLWVNGTFLSSKVELSRDSKGRPVVMNNRERQFAIHKKWWNDAWVNGEMLRAKGNEILIHNASVYSEVYRQLNNNYKLKL